MSAGRRHGAGWRTLWLLAAVPGGYAFSAAWVSATAAVLARAGLARVDAVVLPSMLGFLFFLGFVVWAFAQRSLARLWAVTAGGTALCLALAAGLDAWR